MDERLLRLRQRQIYFGTSSWKYEGWRGLVYKRDYRTIKQFNDQCLEEYAENYPAVGVDHTFYNWPSVTLFQKYVEQTPAEFRFALKATERVTIYHYPKMKRYGKEAGTTNAHFLDAGLFREAFLEPLRPFRDRIGPIMLEFSQFYPGTIASGSEFCERLGKFFDELKNEEDFQFAVEIRNSGWLKEAYFTMLLKHRAAHVFNSWTRMPSIAEQLKLSEPFDLPTYPARLLLRPGREYQEAVDEFAPYAKVQDLQPETREAASQLVRRALRAGKPAFVFVNNRCEGSAPFTILGILDLLADT